MFAYILIGQNISNPLPSTCNIDLNTPTRNWFTGFNHLEKYESQWEGLSHILCKIKAMFETTNQESAPSARYEIYGRGEKDRWNDMGGLLGGPSYGKIHFSVVSHSYGKWPIDDVLVKNTYFSCVQLPEKKWRNNNTNSQQHPLALYTMDQYRSMMIFLSIYLSGYFVT